MHPADIKAELQKRGYTMTAFEKEHDFPSGAVSAALRQGSPKVERALAKFLDLSLKTLFPNRYTDEGQRLSPRERVSPEYADFDSKSSRKVRENQDAA